MKVDDRNRVFIPKGYIEPVSLRTFSMLMSEFVIISVIIPVLSFIEADSLKT